MTVSVRPMAALSDRVSDVATHAPGWLKRSIKDISNVHRPNGEPDVFLFSLPRSGSTWLMELIWGQPGFKCCDEPTDVRNPLVRQHLGLNSWEEIYDRESERQLATYFQRFRHGQHGFMNPNPLRGSYRPRTSRIVFKVIHGYEDRVNWFRDTFDGRVVLLIRHPIPVSLSRDAYPTLGTLLFSEYRRHFSEEQLAFAEQVFATGNKLERGVLSWCLQNAVPLKSAGPDWAVLTYEQLVVDPIPVVDYLCQLLELPDSQSMMRQLRVPSHSTHKSDSATKRAISDETSDQRVWLLEKWRTRVSESEERDAMEILERFDLDLYQFGDVLPSQRLWIPSKTGVEATDDV